MMYYILRLSDANSFNKVFSSIEKFLDVTMTENMQQISSENEISSGNSQDGATYNSTLSVGLISATDYVRAKAQYHCIVNLAMMGVYSLFLLIFILAFTSMKNFDQT